MPGEIMNQLDYILTQCPAEFHGKQNWLGFKATPHTPMRFINQVTAEGVKTNEGFYNWDEVDQKTIQTIYQRLKWNEKLQSK